MDDGAANGLVPVRDHQRLAGAQPVPAVQGPVAPPQAADRDAIRGGDGKERLSPADGVDQAGKAQHQRLAHGQSAVSGDLAAAGEPGGICPVLGSDGE